MGCRGRNKLYHREQAVMLEMNVSRNHWELRITGNTEINQLFLLYKEEEYYTGRSKAADGTEIIYEAVRAILKEYVSFFI